MGMRGEPMSIILKGIDLPDEKLMEMFESDNHICIGGNYYPLMIKDVIQIPKGHGRLIDESTMLKQIEKRLDETLSEEHKKRIGLDIFINELVRHTMIDGEIKTLKEWFKRQPTILEAEE